MATAIRHRCSQHDSQTACHVCQVRNTAIMTFTRPESRRDGYDRLQIPVSNVTIPDMMSPRTQATSSIRALLRHEAAMDRAAATRLGPASTAIARPDAEALRAIRRHRMAQTPQPLAENQEQEAWAAIRRQRQLKRTKFVNFNNVIYDDDDFTRLCVDPMDKLRQLRQRVSITVEPFESKYGADLFRDADGRPQVSCLDAMQTSPFDAKKLNPPKQLSQGVIDGYFYMNAVDCARRLIPWSVETTRTSGDVKSRARQTLRKQNETTEPPELPQPPAPTPAPVSQKKKKSQKAKTTISLSVLTTPPNSPVPRRLTEHSQEARPAGRTKTRRASRRASVSFTKRKEPNAAVRRRGFSVSMAALSPMKDRAPTAESPATLMSSLQRGTSYAETIISSIADEPEEQKEDDVIDTKAIIEPSSPDSVLPEGVEKQIEGYLSRMPIWPEENFAIDRPDPGAIYAFNDIATTADEGEEAGQRSSVARTLLNVGSAAVSSASRKRSKTTSAEFRRAQRLYRQTTNPVSVPSPALDRLYYPDDVFWEYDPYTSSPIFLHDIADFFSETIEPFQTTARRLKKLQEARAGNASVGVGGYSPFQPGIRAADNGNLWPLGPRKRNDRTLLSPEFKTNYNSARYMPANSGGLARLQQLNQLTKPSPPVAKTVPLYRSFHEPPCRN